MSVGTAFHPRTSALNSTMAWGEWSGYFAAAVYADFHDIEYNAIREQAALIDVTPLYKYEITGPDAARLVDRIVTRDASKLAVDRVMTRDISRLQVVDMDVEIRVRPRAADKTQASVTVEVLGVF